MAIESDTEQVWNEIATFEKATKANNLYKNA